MKIALTVILNFKNGAIHLLRCPQLGEILPSIVHVQW